MPENLKNAHRLIGKGNKLCLLVALGGHRRIIADLRDELEPRLQRLGRNRLAARQGAGIVKTEHEQQLVPPRHRDDAAKIEKRQHPPIGLEQHRHFPVSDQGCAAGNPHEMEIEIDLLVRINQPGNFGRQRPDTMMIGRPKFPLAPIGKGFVLVGDECLQQLCVGVCHGVSLIPRRKAVGCLPLTAQLRLKDQEIGKPLRPASSRFNS
ncbi:hypothetical protein [Rhizobium leguminosarum]|uniref:hypothetical protein n=1 Tax=Rhizobium leguminosarum TaxID=384 RepID=UPI001FE1B2BB|nr:hypothetical protein [Rhizobium leguminosarum]